MIWPIPKLDAAPADVLDICLDAALATQAVEAKSVSPCTEADDGFALSLANESGHATEPGT